MPNRKHHPHEHEPHGEGEDACTDQPAGNDPATADDDGGSGDLPKDPPKDPPEGPGGD